MPQKNASPALSQSARFSQRTGANDMKILAQHGHQPGDKIHRGLKENVTDGVIFSARYSPPDKARTLINEARLLKADAEILLDPEFYATRLLGTPNSQLGSLPDWSYFKG